MKSAREQEQSQTALNRTLREENLTQLQLGVFTEIQSNSEANLRQEINEREGTPSPLDSTAPRPLFVITDAIFPPPESLRNRRPQFLEILELEPSVLTTSLTATEVRKIVVLLLR